MKINLARISLKELATYISTALQEKEIDTVLVGGACVEVYSHCHFQSYDLDLIFYAPRHQIKSALQDLGFEEDERYFRHEKCPFLLDFLAPPITIGQESIREFELLSNSLGTIQMLTPTDCVKDRLTSFYLWDDKQGLEQALLASTEQSVDINVIRNWSYTNRHKEHCKAFYRALQQKKTDAQAHAPS